MATSHASLLSQLDGLFRLTCSSIDTGLTYTATLPEDKSITPSDDIYETNILTYGPTGNNKWTPLALAIVLADSSGKNGRA